MNRPSLRTPEVGGALKAEDVDVLNIDPYDELRAHDG